MGPFEHRHVCVDRGLVELVQRVEDRVDGGHARARRLAGTRGVGVVRRALCRPEVVVHDGQGYLPFPPGSVTGGAIPSTVTWIPVASRWLHEATATARHQSSSSPSPVTSSRSFRTVTRQPPADQPPASPVTASCGSSSPPRPADRYVGRSSGTAATSSSRPVTPVSTRSESRSAL